MNLKWWKPLYIGGKENPYMIRWFIIPRNPWFNIYLHNFKRSDDDRALHDHPWWSLGIILKGYYLEHYKKSEPIDYDINWHAETLNMNYKVYRRWVFPWSIKYRGPEFAHRIELMHGMKSVWTIFITGPRVREWGFHCPNGWRHWKDFTIGKNGEHIGRGCD